MAQRLSISLAVVLASGALLAGCGGGSDSASRTQSTSTPATTTTTPSVTTTPKTTGTGATSSAAVKQALEACKRVIEEYTPSSAKTRAKREAACRKAATEPTSSASKVAEEVCKRVINSKALTPQARERVLAACKGVKK
jgi:hypothetical protein